MKAGQKRKKEKTAKTEKPAPKSEENAELTLQPFHIVGVGASAGGVEALREFLKGVPADSGMAFVLILHLSPGQKSMLSDLLAQCTTMDVHLAEEGMMVEPDQVYVIPPNADLHIGGGRLSLAEPLMTRGFRQPIDHFFRSLAEDQGENAIGVILSGTGSDGTLGVKAIKAQGGLVVVQDEESARYPGMPHSAIETGMADLILPLEEIPKRLVEYADRSILIRKRQRPREIQQEISDVLPQIFQVIRGQSGHDFSNYKINTVVRRIARRMAVNGLESPADYLRMLKENPGEIKALFQDLLISVTQFFRDPEAFEVLEEKVIALLVRDHEGEEPLKVWIPGCATGEEAYSVAILFQEKLNEYGRQNLKVQIFATDLDEVSIDFARQGRFPENITADISSERLGSYFRKVDNVYQVIAPVREMIIFSPHNLTRNPPFSRLDLICCRNLLIYLDAEMQKKILPLFHYALKPEGFLFLGTSETVGALGSLFDTLDKKWKIYRRRESAQPVAIDFPLKPAAHIFPKEKVGHPIPPLETQVAALAERALLSRYSPPSVVINEKFEAVHFSTRTSRYLEPPVGEPTMNILKMAREDLRPALRAAVRKALTRKEVNIYQDLRVKVNGETDTINLVVEPYPSQGLALVIFEPVLPSSGSAPSAEIPPTSMRREDQEGIIRQLEEDLRITSEQLQATIEELETSNEELKSSNEELMSMNEELQSTNEEVESSKEELQALNEELTTVNSELERKVLELGDTNSDMQNLLNSSQIATVFLDRQLRVKRFTPAATDIFHLIESDLGRPFHHITCKLDYPDMNKDSEKVLKTLKSREKEVQTSEGRWFLLRILPYRTVKDVIDGVVITLVDITDRKKAHEEQERLAAIVDSSQEAIVGMTLQGRITSWNPGAEKLYGYSAEETVGRLISLLYPPERTQEFGQFIEKLRTGERVDAFETERIRKDGLKITVSISAAPIRDESGQIAAASLIARDVSARKKTEIALKQAKEAAEEADRAKGDFLAKMSHEIRTPLTVILAALEQLGATELAPLQEKLHSLANQSADVLLAMLEDILDFSKIEMGKLELEEHPFVLRDCIDHAILIFSAEAEAKGLELRADLSPDLPKMVVGDLTRLQQIFLNLLSNAVKFTEKGSVTLRVEPARRSMPEPDLVFLDFSVLDTGIGIPPDKISQLFQSFHQLKGKGGKTHKGTGLGLAICKGLVEMMGGTIGVKSEEDKGSTFFFTVPLRIDTGIPAAALSPGAEATKPAKSLNLLIAEDDPSIQVLLKHVISGNAWRATIVDNGAKALAAWEPGKFDAVLLDLQMPEKTGPEVARAIREREKEAGSGHVPLIALTAHATKRDEKRCLDAGMDGFLAKPFSRDKISQIIRTYVEKSSDI